MCDQDQLSPVGGAIDSLLGTESRIAAAMSALQPIIVGGEGWHGMSALEVEDVGCHLRCLGAALELGAPEIYLSYVAWREQLLRSRGWPSALPSFVAGLDRLAIEHFPASLAIHARLILGLARDALAQPGKSAKATGPEPLPQLERCVAKLLAGDHRGALDVCREAMAAGISPIEVAVRIVQPALYRIGTLWQENSITIAQEHLATAICQHLLSTLFMEIEQAPPLEQTAILACVQGNPHSIGLRMIGDALEFIGWDIRFHGADVPTDALIDEVDSVRPRVLLLSVSMPHHLSALRSAITGCRDRLGSAAPFMVVGGLILNLARRPQQLFGADLWVGNALDIVRELGSALALSPAGLPGLGADRRYAAT